MLNLPERTGVATPPARQAAPWPADALHRVAAAAGATPEDVLATLLTALGRRYGHGFRLVAPGGAAAAGAADAPRIAVGPAGGHVDLVVTVAARVEAEARTDAYDAGTVARLLEHLGVLVRHLDADPAASLDAAELLTPDETEFLRRHNAPAVTYPPVTLHELVERQVELTPDAPALVHGDRTLSYRELDEAANAVAGALVERGVRAGSLVAVGGVRSLPLFAGLLGVLKAGGAIVYADPAHPPAHLRALLDAAAPHVALAAPGAVLPEPERPLEVVAIERALAGGGTAGERPRVGPEDPAYVIFTSGTTGVPKGVVRPHRMHTSRIFLEQSLYALDARDRHLLKSPISFREFLWPLASGGTAVVADPGGERDDRYLVSLVREAGISVVSFVPSMLRVLAANPGFAGCPSLRHVFAGGEVLPADLEARLRSFGYEVHNTYTLTEADYVAHRQGPAGTAGGARSVVGRPLDMRTYLADEAGRLVPPGVVGEILTGGPGLATGYLGRPDLTAERFVPNPFDDSVPTLFRTGDLARVLPDGQLEYAGRRDLQVKVRGQRLEPTEVETWLRRFEPVADAAVVGHADEEQGATLVAFVVPGGPAPSTDDLREFLLTHVPDYMVPSYFVVVDRLPKLVSGKVDRAALVAPRRPRPLLDTAYAPPATATERRVAEVWTRAVGVDPVGVDDTFAALGGDSLRLLVLRSGLERELGGRFDLSDLLAHDTVRGQAALVDGMRPAAAPEDAAPDDRRDRARAERERRARLRAPAGGGRS